MVPTFLEVFQGPPFLSFPSLSQIIISTGCTLSKAGRKTVLSLRCHPYVLWQELNAQALRRARPQAPTSALGVMTPPPRGQGLHCALHTCRHICLLWLLYGKETK